MTAISGKDGLPIVELRFESLRALQEELGPYLAQEGLFLRGESGFSPSDVVRFRIMLPGDFVLVEGAGVIVWVRGLADSGPLDPVGAAMGFATLSEQGRELVEQMVQTHIGGGGRPFDLTRPATSVDSQEVEEVKSTPARAGLGLRFNVRAEPVKEPAQDMGAGSAVAAAVANDSEPDSGDGMPPLPFVEEIIERPAAAEPPALEPLVEEDPELVDDGEPEVVDGGLGVAEEMSLKEFGDSILDGEGVPAEPPDEVAPVLDSLLELADPELDPDAVAPAAAGYGSGADNDAVATLEPVLEAAEAFAGISGDEAPAKDGRATAGDPDPGPAFGGDRGGSDGGYLENTFLASLEAETAASRRKSRLYGVLAVVILIAGAWLVWSYVSGGWPFSALVTPPATAAGGAGEPQEILTGDLSDAELEAVVSAAVDAVVQDDGVEPEDEPETAEAGPIADGPVTTAPATVISDVRWEPRTQGTVVIIRANGILDEERVRVEALSSPPRVLVRLRNIVEPYRPLETVVDTADVRAIRMGHHPEKNPPSLWVVLDVNGPGVTIKGVEVEGDTARVLVGR